MGISASQFRITKFLERVLFWKKKIDRRTSPNKTVSILLYSLPIHRNKHYKLTKQSAKKTIFCKIAII